jgi:hypothetical protein
VSSARAGNAAAAAAAVTATATARRRKRWRDRSDAGGPARRHVSAALEPPRRARMTATRPAVSNERTEEPSSPHSRLRAAAGDPTSRRLCATSAFLTRGPLSRDFASLSATTTIRASRRTRGRSTRCAIGSECRGVVGSYTPTCRSSRVRAPVRPTLHERPAHPRLRRREGRRARRNISVPCRGVSSHAADEP